MSSTNRSDARKGHQFDHYATPKWIIEDYFEYVTDWDDETHLYHAKMASIGILDPCAGGSDEAEMPYPSVIEDWVDFGTYPLITADIRKNSRADIIGDFLEMTKEDFPHPIGYIISNPPYTIGKEFVQKSLDIVENGGIVSMLLRIGFLGSAKRFKWFTDHMPEEIIVHHKRPSFTRDGKTDSDYYAHFVWRKGYHPENSRLVLI